MTLLHVSGISKSNETGSIVSDISFHQKKLQKLVIAGETGSGKSTLLKLIAGLEQPDAGEIYFLNKRVEGAHEKLVAGHEQIAYLSQYFELPKFLRVEQILSYSNHLSTIVADEIFEICKITHLLKRKTDQLSGGERQRIGMARALIGAPKLLLLDEPYSNLDVIHKNILKTVIHDIGEKLKITCILVSHDPTDTLSWADEIIILKDGQMVQRDTPEIVYTKPVNEYVAGLFGKYNLITPTHPVFKIVVTEHHDRNLFIRPEHIKIVKRGEHHVRGKIIKRTFFGAFLELEIEIRNNFVLIRTDQFNLALGDTVYLSIPDDDLWDLP
ncbi:MAG TPA: ABC transporter ATP-binding protein [Cyclobacteriaceae bacterium]|jgi:iron(III) transport system ATP-binding protein|nr:ABC transporter ATP-binding protein [Cyclobacteriaceae bacterium]